MPKVMITIPITFTVTHNCCTKVIIDIQKKHDISDNDDTVHLVKHIIVSVDGY